MGKETEEKKFYAIGDQQPQGPKVVKLHYKIEKLRALNKGSLQSRINLASVATQNTTKTNFMIGDKVLSLSKPQNSTIVQEVTPEMLKSKNGLEAAAETDRMQTDDSINTVTRDQLMNLNDYELKYLKNIVVDKFKDANHDKLYRSKRRYGW